MSDSPNSPGKWSPYPDGKIAPRPTFHFFVPYTSTAYHERRAAEQRAKDAEEDREIRDNFYKR